MVAGASGLDGVIMGHEELREVGVGGRSWMTDLQEWQRGGERAAWAWELAVSSSA